MQIKRWLLIGTWLCLGIGAAQAAGDPLRGKALFGQCGFCHSTEPGKHGMGPSLQGIYARTAGQAVGFDYSPALKGAGVQWDAGNLDRWLSNPASMIPGNRMMFPGVADQATRDDLISYLKTLL